MPMKILSELVALLVAVTQVLNHLIVTVDVDLDLKFASYLKFSWASSIFLLVHISPGRERPYIIRMQDTSENFDK